MQYFASFQPFEVFSEFNGVPGNYIKSFLISDKVNLNKWQATHASNLSNLDSFLGRPGIHYINSEAGKRETIMTVLFQNLVSLHSCPCALHSEQYIRGTLSSLIVLKCRCDSIK